MATFFPFDSRSIRSWDRAFLAGRVREAEDSRASTAASAYFPFRRVLSGVSELARRSFGITLTEMPMDDSEKWCDGAIKLAVKRTDDRSGSRFGSGSKSKSRSGSGSGSESDAEGIVYLDVLPRKGKFPHAAHFVARCGRANRGGSTSGGHATRQIPRVALVTNFGHPGIPNLDALALSHSEVETFLHEFGHAAHSVLSRTEYQHLSGTRCAADLVEVPSHVFEYFAWDAQSLQVLSGHTSTGDPVPAALIAALRRGRDAFAATDFKQQVLFAEMDLRTHLLTNDRSASGSGGPSRGDGRVSLRDIRRIAGALPSRLGGDGGGAEEDESECAWELRFGHVVGYASTYYSYVYARLIAAQIWRTYFEDEALAPGAGTKLAEGLLSKGGAVAPEVLLRDLLGHDALREVVGDDPGTSGGGAAGFAPNPEALLREILGGTGFRV
jgi:intermediate peptidase